MPFLRGTGWLFAMLVMLPLLGCSAMAGLPMTTTTEPTSAPEMVVAATVEPTQPRQPVLTATATGRSITPSPTATPSSISTAIPSATPSMTPSATPIPFSEQDSIGVSIGGRELRHTRIGLGQTQLVLLGALHGGHECNTRDLLEAVQARLLAEPELVPATMTVHILPELNPDGCLLDTRENARGVDLNRNWDTPNWASDAEGPYGYVPGSGGDIPFSETETYYLSRWLLALREEYPEGPIIVISYHSAFPPTGMVLPGYQLSGATDAAAAELAQFYSEQTGYLYETDWLGHYSITGELVYWLTLNGFVGLDVELPDRLAAEGVPAGFALSHIDNTWQALLALFARIAASGSM